MKKLIIALVATASIASADITVNLFTGYGFTDDGDILIDTGETALIQLINAGANGAADAVTATGAGMFGDDVLIGSLSITGAADPYAAPDYTGYASIAGTTFEESGTAGANVFARIYQDSTASNGSLYYDGTIVAIPNVNLNGTPTPTATSYNFGGNGGVDTADFATVIPEPATIGLMGIAAAGLFTARRKVRV